jgi:hypothetical protein
MPAVTPRLGIERTDSAPSERFLELQEALEIYETEKKLQFEQAKFIFEQSRTYHTVIMGLAYGGFFALWSSTSSFVTDKKTMALAGGLMTLSIIAFAVFTIINMYILSKVTLRNAQLAQKFGNPKTAEDLIAVAQQIAEYRDKMNSDIRSASAQVAILWPPFFFTSLISGVAAALILLFVLLKHHGLGIL